MNNFKNKNDKHKNEAQILCYSQLYHYLKDFLFSKIPISTTKRIFLLSIYNLLTNKIDFEIFTYIASELGFQLNNFSNLLEKDGNLASLILDLDELDEKKLSNSKDRSVSDLKRKLILYYKSSLSEEYHIRESFINKIRHELSKMNNISKVKEFFLDMEEKRECSLGEICAFATIASNKIKEFDQKLEVDHKERYFVQILDRMSDLVINWFLETEENYSYLMNILKNIAIHPKDLDNILRKTIMDYFNQKISKEILTKSLFEIRDYSILTEDKKIMRATEPINDFSISNEQKFFLNSVKKCLEILEE